MIKKEEVYLEDSEWKVVQSFVCYEKTLYHFFKRILKIEFFELLFFDRYIGFQYTEGMEPLIPLENSLLTRIRNQFQTDFNVEIDKVEDFLKIFQKAEFCGQVQLLTVFPDGNSIYTSALIEDLKDNTVYFTRTTAVEKRVRTPMPLNTFVESLLYVDGKTTISIFNSNSEYLQYLKNLSDKNLMLEVGKYFGYTAKNDNLYLYGKLITPNKDALEHLKKDILNKKGMYIDSGIPKKDQFRLHKHISNKIIPAIMAWEHEEKLPASIKSSLINVREDLNNLYKWFSLFYIKHNEEIFEKYIQQLERFIFNYSIFQTQIHHYLIKIISV